MILNHNDNHALFLHTIDHGEYKPLMDAYGELLTTINHLSIDGETRSKLFELATNAVERAEDNAFDKAAELQAVITTDELTDRKEDDEILSTPSNDNGQSNPTTPDGRVELLHDDTEVRESLQDCVLAWVEDENGSTNMYFSFPNHSVADQCLSVSAYIDEGGQPKVRFVLTNNAIKPQQ
mgnify:FL=1